MDQAIKQSVIERTAYRLRETFTSVHSTHIMNINNLYLLSNSVVYVGILNTLRDMGYDTHEALDAQTSGLSPSLSFPIYDDIRELALKRYFRFLSAFNALVDMPQMVLHVQRLIMRYSADNILRNQCSVYTMTRILRETHYLALYTSWDKPRQEQFIQSVYGVIDNCLHKFIHVQAK